MILKTEKEEIEILNKLFEDELGSRLKKVVLPQAYDWLIRSLSKISRASYMEGLEDGKDKILTELLGEPYALWNGVKLTKWIEKRIRKKELKKK